MADWVSDSDDEFEWDSDGDGEVAGSHDGAGTSAAASRSVDAPGPSTLAGPSSHSLEQLENFVGMGFKRNTVLEAMKKNGDGDADSLLLLILTLQEIENDPSLDNGSASSRVPQPVDDSDDEGFLENWDDEAAGGSSHRGPISDDSGDETPREICISNSFGKTVWQDVGSTPLLFGAWIIWNHRNRCVFDGIAPSLAAALVQTGEERKLWEMAGAKGISLLIGSAPRRLVFVFGSWSFLVLKA